MYERIIVALDGSELAERVLPHIEPLAEKFGSTLILLRTTPDEAMLAGQFTTMPLAGVVPPPEHFDNQQDIIEAAQAEVSRYLVEVAERLQSKGLTAQVCISEGRPAETIVEQVEVQNAGMIAMTTHGRGGLGRIFMGSVAEEVLRTATCPVLVVRVGSRE